MHKNRTWCVSRVEDAHHLAHQLGEGGTWTLCTGFRVANTPYLWLNDSTSENGAQEYALVKEMDNGETCQLESLTVGWMDADSLKEHVRAALAGEYDDRAGRPITVRLETPDEHGVCPFCA